MFKHFPQISRKISWVLFFILLLALIWRGSFFSLDPDLGWHLKFGRDIAETHQIPHDQIHLWTINGTWVDHEWLTNWLMFNIYQQTDYIGLTLFFSLLVLTGLYLIARHLRQKNSFWSKDILIGLLIFLGWLAIRPHLGGPRPQVISFLLLIVEILWLKKINLKINWRSAVELIIFFWLWASLHAGFIAGLGVLGLWGIYNTIEALRHKRKILWPVMATLGAVGATIITPYGWQLYGFLSTYTNTAYLKHISEWKSAWTYPIFYWQLLFIAISIAITIVIFIFKKYRQQDVWLWLASAVFLVMALKSIRNFPLFFASASLTVMPGFFKFTFDEYQPKTISNKTTTTLKILVPTLLFLTAWYNLLATNFLRDPFINFCDDYPCQTARALQENTDYNQLRLLDNYGYGGWLIWVWPEKKLFIDGRIPQYPFNGHSLLEEYLKFSQPNLIADELETYDIEAVLWNNKLPIYHLNWLDKFLGFTEVEINSRKDELKIYLDNSSDWQPVYVDGASTVYVRKDKL